MAIGLPVVVTFSTPLLLYVFDRVQWAAPLYGKYSPPMPSRYFDLSNAWHLWLFLLVSVANSGGNHFQGLTPAAFRRALRLTARNFADRTDLGRDVLCIRFALQIVIN